MQEGVKNVYVEIFDEVIKFSYILFYNNLSI